MNRKLQNPDPPGGERTTRVATIPNIICGFRLLGSIVLVILAATGRNEIVLWLFVILAMSDWVDGKLAILLNQRSVLGARLDSWADAALYLALLIAALLLHGPALRSEAGWILPPLTTYGLSIAAGFWKFRRWPSYHTRAAKISWFLILVGASCLLGGWNLWPLRVALAAVTLTNLEATWITLASREWRADVNSIIDVLRSARKP